MKKRDAHDIRRSSGFEIKKEIYSYREYSIDPNKQN
jgi:hypothetical protein